MYIGDRIKYIEDYLFDSQAGYTQKDFDDLVWKKADTLEVTRQYYQNKPLLWLVKGSRTLQEFSDQGVRLLSRDHALGHNRTMKSGMILDGWRYSHFAEIPSVEYMFQKFYADKYSSIKDAKRALIKNIKDEEKQKEKEYREYQKRTELISKIKSKASFFVTGSLTEDDVKKDVGFKKFPVIYRYKTVGSAMLLENVGGRVNIAVTIHKKDKENFKNLKGLQYDFGYDTEQIDGKSYITKFKAMEIIIE